MEAKVYRIGHWVGGKLPDNVTKGPEPIGNEAQAYSITLTAEEIIGLSATYDVMICGEKHSNVGTRKNPKVITTPATIYLDDHGRRFRQR